MATATQHRKASSVDPDALVQQLKDQLKQSQIDQDKLTKQNVSIKEDITALEKWLTEIKQAETAYDQGYTILAKEKRELIDYLDTKAKMIEGALGRTKVEIDRKISDYDNSIADKQREAEDLEKERNEATNQYDKAKAGLSKKQDSFDSRKNYTANLSKQFKESRDLRTQIEKEDGQNHPAEMYFLTTELKKILDGADVISQKDLRTNLNQAWNDLKLAK